MEQQILCKFYKNLQIFLSSMLNDVNINNLLDW
jgi:hypothetical protein